jgi:hypothetical protein
MASTLCITCLINRVILRVSTTAILTYLTLNVKSEVILLLS